MPLQNVVALLSGQDDLTLESIVVLLKASLDRRRAASGSADGEVAEYPFQTRDES